MEKKILKNGIVLECSCDDFQKDCIPCNSYGNCELKYEKANQHTGFSDNHFVYLTLVFILFVYIMLYQLVF